jgi:peroxiredoxin Q/BCP
VRTTLVISILALAVAASCRKAEQPSAGAAKTAPGPANPSSLLQMGAPIPDVSAEAHTGERVRLADLKGKPVVVYFYPKDDTRGCTIEAEEIRDLYADIQKTGAVVLGVSTDGTASHKAFAEKYQLPFMLLPDEDQRIANAFGVPLRMGRATRVSFVFGPDGRVSKVFPDVTPKGHGRELLEALQAHRG